MAFKKKWLYLHVIKTTDIMIKVENIKCNGISYAPELNDSLTERLINAIDARKQSKIWINRAEVDSNDWFMKGSRYHNTRRNLQVIVSNALCQIDEENVEDYFTNISDEHFNIWIDKCLLYSGSADYYYKYEKEWD